MTSSDAFIFPSDDEDSFRLVPSPEQLRAIREEIHRRGWSPSEVLVSGYRMRDPSIPVLRFSLREEGE